MTCLFAIKYIQGVDDMFALKFIQGEDAMFAKEVCKIDK
jgi:hypothetical protein